MFIEVLLDSNSGRCDTISFSKSPVKLNHKYAIFWFFEIEKAVPPLHIYHTDTLSFKTLQC